MTIVEWIQRKEKDAFLRARRTSVTRNDAEIMPGGQVTSRMRPSIGVRLMRYTRNILEVYQNKVGEVFTV